MKVFLASLSCLNEMKTGEKLKEIEQRSTQFEKYTFH